MKDGDSANLSNQNASAYEAEANEFQIDENTQNLSGIFQHFVKNQMKPNGTIQKSGNNVHGRVDERLEGNQRPQLTCEEHSSQPLHGGSGVGAGFDLSDLGNLILSQFNPFAAMNSGGFAGESVENNNASESQEQSKFDVQYRTQDYRTGGTDDLARNALHSSSDNENDNTIEEQNVKSISRIRKDVDSLRKQKSCLNIDESMEMNDEESQKLKQMMQDSEHRKVLQKKGVSHKTNVGGHRALDGRGNRDSLKDSF